jgi:hypothetical protein
MKRHPLPSRTVRQPVLRHLYNKTEKIVYMKFLLVTYPDSESGHPTKYVRDSIPEIKSYPGGATTPLLKRSLSSLANSWATRLARLGSSRGWKAWGIKW